MPHVRETIRKRAATAITGLATAGTNVYTSRVYLIENQTLPCISVYSLSEEVDIETMPTGSHKAERTLELSIECRARATSLVDDVLDDMCAEIETALQADIDDVNTVGALGTLLKWGELRTTEIDLEDGAQQPTGVARMVWTLIYRADTTDPTATVS